MNKVNLCWVLTEGRTGHTIQSAALANRIAQHTAVFQFNMRQPWSALTPRLIPRFKQSLTWHQDQAPDVQKPPDIIITTGRKAAAVGKFFKQQLQQTNSKVKHIQILNPKDATENYDMLLVPAHDQLKGRNIINFCGSIHPYDSDWYQKHLTDSQYRHHTAVILGNPPSKYMNQQWSQDMANIKQSLPTNETLMVCGSPRLSAQHIQLIKKSLDPGDPCWFSEQDGPNPYQHLLLTVKRIFVSADSINMMNECASSQAEVRLLAANWIQSPKHQRFIEAMARRWSDHANSHDSQWTAPYAINQIIQDDRFQKLLNSPTSSKSG